VLGGLSEEQRQLFRVYAMDELIRGLLQPDLFLSL